VTTKNQIEVITLSRSRELVWFTAEIVYKDGKYVVEYDGDDYEVKPKKVFLSKRKPVMIVNPFPQHDMVHTLTDEVWLEKIKEKAGVTKEVK